MQPPKRNKIFRFVLIGLVVGLVVLFVFLLAKQKQVEVKIFVVPSDSTATMDGKPIKSGKTKIPAGKHVFAASRQYFDSVTQEINTDDLDPKTIYLALFSNSPEGDAYLASHPEEQLSYERIGGAQYDKTQKQLQQYPIVGDLPYQTTDFKIDYDITKEYRLVLLVALYPVAVTPGTELYKQQLLQLKSEANAWLASKGIDLSTADVHYAPDPDKL